MTLTLLRQGHPLADPDAQRALLERPHGPVVPFDRRVADAGVPPVTAGAIDVLQINVGKLCNQTCAHCHVDAGPERREVMTRETMEACLAALRASAIGTVDITGGAPEMNPHFRWLVAEVRALGRRVID